MLQCENKSILQELDLHYRAPNLHHLTTIIIILRCGLQINLRFLLQGSLLGPTPFFPRPHPSKGR